MKSENAETKLGVHKHDARNLNEVIKNKIVSVTVTSPPYFDLKDYGCKAQIGYGQNYQQYLADLKTVFKSVYDCTKDSGTLWVIIDSFRSNNEVVPLPFDFANCVKEIGWKLQEVIIWAKDRTVPWIHKGQMRNLFEYILLFSKNNEYNFYVDEVRDFETLKKWWVKYPERYNPKGKTPSALWNFEIPTQGSWGNGYIKHFCPLPEEMISQILKLTTREGDIVLDPFAGSGAVLAKANNMNRKYVGFELNPSYISMFKNYLKKTDKQKNKKYTSQKANQLSQSEFNDLILDLRALKYPKLILKKLPGKISEKIKKIYVEKRRVKTTQRNAHLTITYVFHTTKELKKAELISELNEISQKPPLSKFGIQPIFEIETNANNFLLRMGKTSQLFVYTNIVTHKYNKSILGTQFINLSKSNIILSKIKVNLNEKDYE